MTEQESKADPTANERVGADQPEDQARDTSHNPFTKRQEDLMLAAVVVGCAVALYALRMIPLPKRG